MCTIVLHTKIIDRASSSPRSLVAHEINSTHAIQRKTVIDDSALLVCRTIVHIIVQLIKIRCQSLLQEFIVDHRKHHSTWLLCDDTDNGGGLHLKPPKFEHIFAAVITFFPFFCANTFDTSLLLIVCALR